MIVDIGLVSGWIGALTVITGVFAGIYRTMHKHFISRMDTITGRLTDIEKWTGKQQEDIDDGKIQDRLMLEGILACLQGLKQQNCNGPVSASIEEINKYLVERAHQTKSRKS